MTMKNKKTVAAPPFGSSALLGVVPIPEKLIKKFMALRAERARLEAEQEKVGRSIMRRLLKEKIAATSDQPWQTQGDVMAHMEKYHPELKPMNILGKDDHWGYNAFHKICNGE